MRNILIATFLLIFASPVFAAEDYLNQGANYLTARKYNDAVRSYKLAIEIAPQRSEGHKGLGLALYGMADYGAGYNVELLDGAVAALSKSVSIEPNAEACYFLGLAYLGLEDKRNAKTAYICVKSMNEALAEELKHKIDSQKEHSKTVTLIEPEPGSKEALELARNRAAAERAERERIAAAERAKQEQKADLARQEEKEFRDEILLRARQAEFHRQLEQRERALERIDRIANRPLPPSARMPDVVPMGRHTPISEKSSW